MRRVSAAVFTAVLLLPLICGCGGGGGGSSRQTGTVSGVVMDTAGNLIPGAVVEVLETGTSTRSLQKGVFKMAGIEPGWVNIKATADLGDGREWTGVMATQVFENGPTQNVNVIVGPISELGEFDGYVRDTAGKAIPNARVFASARFPQGAADSEANFVSMVEYTDNDGYYSMRNVPSKIRVGGADQTIDYKLVASSVGRPGMPRGFDNSEKTAILEPSPKHTPVDFVLTASSDVTVDVPADWWLYVQSWTMPDSIISRGPQPYEAIKASYSKEFKSALAAHKTATRSTPRGSLIQVEVIWLDSWTEAMGSTPQSNLAGFALYRRDGVEPTVSDTYQLDFVRDPFATFYSDTDSQLSVGRTYYYGVTAVSTSYLDQNDQFNPTAESTMSQISWVQPIGQVSETGPSDNQSASRNSLRFTWNRVTGASNYQVLLYDGYPITYTGPTDDQGYVPTDWDLDHIAPFWVSNSTTGTSATYDGRAFSDGSTIHAGTYYWVVLANNGDEDHPAYSVGELRRVRVQ